MRRENRQSRSFAATTEILLSACPPRQLVAAAGQLLLGLKQLQPSGKPLFTCSGHVLRHLSCLLPSSFIVRFFPFYVRSTPAPAANSRFRSPPVQ